MTCTACPAPFQCRVWGHPLCYPCLGQCVREGFATSTQAVAGWISETTRDRARSQRREAAVSP